MLKDWPLFAFCWLTVLSVFRSHWESSTSMFLGTYPRTSWSFRVSARMSKQAILQQAPSVTNAAAMCPLTVRSIYCITVQTTEAFENLGLVNSCEPVLSHHVLSDFWNKVGTTLSFPSNNLYSKLQNQDDGQQTQGLVPGSESSWVGQLQRATE